MSDKLSLSVIVPVYKNAESLKELISRLTAQLSKEFSNPEDYEIVFVVDGSPDASLSILLDEKAALKNTLQKIRIIELSQNYGQTAAIIAGIEYSSAQACIVISADLQDPPECIDSLINSWNEGFEIVISTRESRKDGRLVGLTSKIAHTVFRFSQPNMPRNGFDFFLISRDAATHLIKIRGRNRFLQGDILSLGFSQKIVSHDRVARKVGKSSYNFKSRFKLFIDSLFENTRFPITLIFGIGTSIAILGMVIAIISVINYYVGSTPFNGFAAIFSSILFLGGLQIFLIGLIGQFIYRTFEISRGRPLYIVKNNHI
jgi:glycosyltransferase involved in cell wall biosynthesis